MCSSDLSREPLQLGAELYGHAGLEADLEILELALQGLRQSGLTDAVIDLGDARIVSTVLEGQDLSEEHRQAVLDALAAKDTQALKGLTHHLDVAVAGALEILVSAYGDDQVLNAAHKALAAWPLALSALDDLTWLTRQLNQPVMYDLADARGYAYYSGIRFAIYVSQLHEAVIRGGRYDEVGAVFGRRRAAVGFSLDLKSLVTCVQPAPGHKAIRATWAEDAGLRAAIARLRERGETVACVLPGHDSEAEEFECDRELVFHAGQWIVRPL